MSEYITKLSIQELIAETNEESRIYFYCLGNGRRTYTRRQKEHVFTMVDIYGVRGTSRILQIPRRTIQRWCRQSYVRVWRCPAWVYEWAERRRKRRAFWESRGYF